MSEIKFRRRCKYAGEVFNALVEKCGFPLEEASNFLNSIPDADVVECKSIERVIDRLKEVSFNDIDEMYADDGQLMLFLHDAIEIIKDEVM